MRSAQIGEKTKCDLLSTVEGKALPGKPLAQMEEAFYSFQMLLE